MQFVNSEYFFGEFSLHWRTAHAKEGLLSCVKVRDYGHFFSHIYALSSCSCEHGICTVLIESSSPCKTECWYMPDTLLSIILPLFIGQLFPWLIEFNSISFLSAPTLASFLTCIRKGTSDHVGQSYTLAEHSLQKEECDHKQQSGHDLLPMYEY